MNKGYMCCICGKFHNDFGNNPFPVVKENKRCCNACNNNYVIPARIEAIFAKKEETVVQN